ncbi:MAG TPA: glycosyltransferase [Gaiellaceae bacterium]|nr:glycosyltransferase [Gaiellaceae bacterium]
MRVLGIAFLASAGGDFHPLVAAAAGLRARGHHVQLFCDPEGARLVVETGIGTVVDEEGWAAAARVDDELRPRVQQGAPEERTRLVAEWLDRRMNTVRPAFVQAVKQARPDVLVSATLAAPIAWNAAGETGTAWCVVNSTYDMARAPETPVAEWLARALRAAPLVLHATDAVFDDGEPVPGREYVGPLFWEPSAPVPSYLLEEGPPWALVSVSLAPQGDIALVPAALKAISALGLRGVATIGDKNDPAAVGPLPPGAHLENSLSHAAVLERAALLVSHAGHGSVSKALWYGVPMVLVPWGRDQPGVALRAERLGVARVVSPSDLDALPDAIADVLTDERYRTSAASHASRIRSGDPLTLACDRIEAYVATASPW